MQVRAINSYTVFKGVRNNKAENTQQSRTSKNTEAENTIKTGAMDALSALGANAAVGVKKARAVQEVQEQIDPAMGQIQELFDFYKRADKKMNTITQYTQEQLEQTTESAQNLFDEVIDVYEKIKKDNSDPLVKLTYKNKFWDLPPDEVMEEFDENGKVKRRTTFSHDSIRPYKLIRIRIEENPEELPNGTTKAEKRVEAHEFQHEIILDGYLEDYVRHPDGKTTYAKIAYFDKMGAKECKEYPSDEDDFQYAKKYSRIILGKPCNYEENNRSVRIEGRNLSGVTKEYTETQNTPDSTGTIKSVSYCPFPYIVNNSYSEGEISVREYNKEQIQELVVKDGKPVRYILVDEKGRWPKIIKQYQMTEDGWKKVIG
ncbi:TPA: hypothetical protein IAA87_03690 [Candidatus Avigastranaerophilus faecigallinarum]|nr:hypothetical protein [Candidatus Avigastranaerophilus faecigallinarum]